jgi:hypothetical protein
MVALKVLYRSNANAYRRFRRELMAIAARPRIRRWSTDNRAWLLPIIVLG